MLGSMRRGGNKVRKVDLDGYEANATHQEWQVAKKATRSQSEPKREKIDHNR